MPAGALPGALGGDLRGFPVTLQPAPVPGVLRPWSLCDTAPVSPQLAEVCVCVISCVKLSMCGRRDQGGWLLLLSSMSKEEDDWFFYLRLGVVWGCF